MSGGSLISDFCFSCIGDAFPLLEGLLGLWLVQLWLVFGLGRFFAWEEL